MVERAQRIEDEWIEGQLRATQDAEAAARAARERAQRFADAKKL
jgi:hypothetical protein